MARRSDHTREELYKISLESARSIVAEAGLQALTARRIAREIGYSPGTLYNVFKDRSDLIIHLNGKTLDDLYQHLSQTGLTDGAPENLRQLLNGYLEYFGSHRNLWEALFEYQLPEERSLPTWYLEKVAKLMNLIEKALQPVIPYEERDALASSARVLWASLHGIISLSEAGKLKVISDRSLEDMAEMLLVNFVTGLQQNYKKG